MGKNKKEHRKKVAKRNEALKIQENRIKKMQQDYIMQMIQREKEAGKFDDVKIEGVDGPAIGPQI